MMTKILLPPISVGSGSAAAQKWNRKNLCRNSSFFEKKQCEIRFIFCPDSDKKPHVFLNFSREIPKLLHNILQINDLHSPNPEYSDNSDYSESHTNSLIYKILSCRIVERIEKMKKLMHFLTRFFIAFYTFSLIIF